MREISIEELEYLDGIGGGLEPDTIYLAALSVAALGVVGMAWAPTVTLFAAYSFVTYGAEAIAMWYGWNC